MYACNLCVHAHACWGRMGWHKKAHPTNLLAGFNEQPSLKGTGRLQQRKMLNVLCLLLAKSLTRTCHSHICTIHNHSHSPAIHMYTPHTITHMHVPFTRLQHTQSLTLTCHSHIYTTHTKDDDNDGNDVID